MDNSLRARLWREKFNAMLTGRIAEHLDHLFSHIVSQRSGLVIRRNNMIDGCIGPLRIGNAKPLIFQHAKGLRTGHLMDQVQRHK